MRTALVLAAIALVLLLLAPGVLAGGPQWPPFCKDKDVRAGAYAHLHVGVDCYPGVWLDVCPPGQACTRHDLADLLS